MSVLVSTALALTLVIASWLAGSAQANPITFSFSGALDTVAAPLSSQFSVGQAFSGNFAYESSTAPNTGAVPTVAIYNALTGFSATIGSYTAASFSPSGANESVSISNHPAGSGGIDTFQAQPQASFGLAGPAVGGLALQTALVTLDDFKASVFGPDDTVVPLPTSLNLSDFDRATLTLIFAGGVLTAGPVSGLAPAVVPEPTTLLLFGTTMAGLGLGARWRRRRQS